ncbi:MAG: SPOR domain-containing protein, partial [Oligoflexia bacterium]|nr:SPOR domain-containing protein [Oligoflexia bacterium]
MKKEFYKLSIVFTMIVFAFALAFFLGKEVTLSGQQKSKKKPPISPHTPTALPENKISSEDFTDKQREKVKEYKKNLVQDEPSEKENQLNKKEKIKPTEVKKEPQQKPKEIYALFLASYKDKETATEQSTQLKLRFPKWKIFFKKEKEVYKVYIGPFKSKPSAENFLKELQKKS